MTTHISYYWTTIQTGWRYRVLPSLIYCTQMSYAPTLSHAEVRTTYKSIMKLWRWPMEVSTPSDSPQALHDSSIAWPSPDVCKSAYSHDDPLKRVGDDFEGNDVIVIRERPHNHQWWDLHMSVCHHRHRRWCGVTPPMASEVSCTRLAVEKATSHWKDTASTSLHCSYPVGNEDLAPVIWVGPRSLAAQEGWHETVRGHCQGPTKELACHSTSWV